MGERRREWAWSDDDSDGLSNSEKSWQLSGGEEGEGGKGEWVFSDDGEQETFTQILSDLLSPLRGEGEKKQDRKEEGVLEKKEGSRRRQIRSGSFTKGITPQRRGVVPPSGSCSTSTSSLPQMKKQRTETCAISPTGGSLSESLVEEGNNGLPVFHSMRRWIKGLLTSISLFLSPSK